MKILITTQYYYPENFTITNIAEDLSKRGHEVDVLTGKPNYGFDRILPEYKKIDFEVINKVNVYRCNIKPRKKNRLSVISNYLSYYFKSIKWVKRCKKKYDVVFSMSLSPVTILGPANEYKKRFNVKHICYCVDLWPESVISTRSLSKKSLLYKLLFKWSRKLYSKCDEILVSSPSFSSYFKDELKLNIPTKTIYQTSLIEDYKNIQSQRFDEYFDILYCGNIGTIQGVENIPEIMSYVTNDRVRFHIIGFGKNSKLLQENIAKYGVFDRVIYHGGMHFKKTIPYLLSCDACYVSLTCDGYIGKTIPNKLNYYLSFGKPILGVFNGDANEILKDAGGIVSKMDFKTIAKNIDCLSSLEKEKLNLMGKRAREYYEKWFSLKTIVNKIENSLTNFN